MNSQIFDELKKQLSQIFNRIMSNQELNIESKADQSVVTKVDLQFSNTVKNWAKIHFPDFHFYSEEEISTLKFPSIILDPIDGTKELIQNIPECCLSMAICYDSNIKDPRNRAYIFNPFTGFEMISHDHFYENSPAKKPLLGFISRTEIEKGLISELLNEEFHLVAKGSIAYKLALTASKISDFSISHAPKNLWDIAGGTILCNERGVLFYEQCKLVTHFNKATYNPPLVWADEKTAPLIFKKLT